MSIEIRLCVHILRVYQHVYRDQIVCTYFASLSACLRDQIVCTNFVSYQHVYRDQIVCTYFASLSACL